MKMAKKERQSIPAENDRKNHQMDNQNGSVTVLVLMVLTIMTVIGIVSSDSLVTENFIIRNVGIYKQNVNLVDSALMLGYQQFMQINGNFPGFFNVDASLTDWLNNRNNNAPVDNEFLINTRWYEDTFSQRCLNANNSLADNSLPLLTTRGENGLGNLRYAIVGWQSIGSLVMGQPNWHVGRMMAEYVSADAGGNDNGFGMLRQEIGLRRRW